MTAFPQISLDPSGQSFHIENRCSSIGRGQAGPVLTITASRDAVSIAAGGLPGASVGPMPEQTWLCIQHRADDGPRVRLAIRREGFEVHWPREIVRQPRKDDTLRPYFPGYMFVQMDPARDRWGLLREIPNVIGILGVRERGAPVVVPEGIVAGLIAKAGGAIDGVIDRTPDAVFTRLRRGDHLRLVDGPFAGMIARFEAERGDERVAVLLDVMGCARRAVVQRAAVERTG